MAESTLFKTLGHNHHTDVLLLVENSQAMSFIWDDLRDRFLVKLMDKLKIATDHRANMVSVWVLESQPLQASSTTQPRQYHDPHHALREVCLNYMVENRISTSKINTAIDFLASLGHPQETRALHLIIVATSSPVIDSVGPNVVKTMNGAAEHSAWGFLAERLAQTNIHCHTLTRSNEDITALTTLFDETLRLGNSIEDLVSFAVDPEVQIRLSMAPMPPSNFNAYGQVNPPPRPMRTMMPRRNTFPLDPCYTEQYQDKQQQPPRAPEMDAPPPSLVTQLQQVHGLTKKKVYGTKPPRKPFFKEDRVEQHLRGAYHHATPAVLTGSSSYIPDATAQYHTLSPASGRVLSLSKLDRIARIQAGPTDVHSRRQMGWARRGSRLSSPEPAEPMGSPASGAGFSDTSPTASSYFSSDVSSPVSPASVEEIYGIQPGHATMSTVIVNGGNTDPTWLQSGYSPAFIRSNHSMAPIPQAYFIPAASVPGYPGHSIVSSYPNMTPPLEPPLLDGVNLLVEPPKNVIPVHVLDSSNSVPVHAPSKALRRPEPEAIINPVSSPPTSAPSSTKISTKKPRHNPEDDEYFELDQQYVEDTNNLFNEFFPNAGKLPETPPSGTKLASNGAIPPSSSDSSRPKDVHTYLSPRRDASGSTISLNMPPSSIDNGPSASMKVSSSLPPNASISSPSSGTTVAIEKPSTSFAPHGFHSPFTPPSHPSLSMTPVLPSGMVDSRAHSMPIPGLGPYHPSTTYPSARGTSSLTGWAG